MSPSWRGYYHYLLLDHWGADIYNHHGSCDDHHRHHYFFVNLDLFDHRAANDDLHRAGYYYVYDHHVALNDEHLDYHFPAPDDHDHGGADIDFYDDPAFHDDIYVGPRIDHDHIDVLPDDDVHVHVHYDPDDYEYLDGDHNIEHDYEHNPWPGDDDYDGAVNDEHLSSR